MKLHFFYLRVSKYVVVMLHFNDLAINKSVKMRIFAHFSTISWEEWGKGIWIGCCNLGANFLKHKTVFKLCKHFKLFRQHAANSQSEMPKIQTDKQTNRQIESQSDWQRFAYLLMQKPKANLKQLVSHFELSYHNTSMYLCLPRNSLYLTLCS